MNGTTYAQLDLPELGGLEEAPLEAADLIPVSKKPAKIDFPLEKGHDSVGFYFTLNFPGELRVGVETADKKKHFFTFRPISQSFERTKSASEAFGMTKREITEVAPEFKNQALVVRGLDLTYFVRPFFKRYKDAAVNKNLAKWDELPDALNKLVRFDARTVGDSIRIYIDGRYAGMVPRKAPFTNLSISGGQGPSINQLKSYVNEQSTTQYESIDLANVANTGLMTEANTSLKPGFQNVRGIPMFVSAGKNSSDLSLTKATRGLELLEVDYNLSRDSFERLPEAQIISVPQDYYNKVYVLFALDPDEKKERAMTIRMTRFCDGDGRGSALAHTDVILPKNDSQFPSNIKQVGTVTLKGTSLPLYLGEFPIKIGELLDIIDNDPHPRRRNKKSPYLDLEFFGSRGGIGAYGTGHMKPSGRLSAFNLFGVTLQRAPVELHLTQSQPGNIFNNEDIAETTATLKSPVGGSFTLEWTIDTIDGKDFMPDQLDWIPKPDEKPLKTERRDIVLKAGESKEIKIPLAMPDLGHYLIRFQVSDKSVNRPLYHHVATFALLGKDDRLASPEESPFGSWWTTAHHGTNNPDVAMKILNKAGIRRVPPGCAAPNGPLTRVVADRYKITLNQYGWINQFDPDDQEKSYEYFKEQIDPVVKAFPETKAVTIFHESYGDPLPPEILGEKMVYSDAQRDKDLKFVAKANRIAEYYREKFPDVKLIYGNNTSSSGLTAALLRNHFDVKLMDYIGLETPAQGCIPERLWQGGTQGAWFAKETARLFGHDIKVTGCYEYSARPRRILGYQRQAEYLIRDALIGLSYGFKHLGISGLSDPGNGYNQTLWGDGGLCERGPNFYPKPIYVAYATLTKAMDQGTLKRKMETTSNTTYVHEYARKRGDFTYAMWLPRGKATVTFAFPKDTEAELLSFYGKSKKIKTSGNLLTVEVGTAPCYLISSIPADSAKLTERVIERPPEQFVVANPMDTLSQWRIIGSPHSLPSTGWDIFRRPGKFEIREVNDEKWGKCLELKLIQKGQKPDVFAEYTKIELRHPVPVKGEPNRIGLMVNGDSGWGKIGFEIQDADGFLWRTEGMWNDFPGDTYLNFDGWQYLSVPITGRGMKPLINQSLGGLWNSNGARRGISYPIKIVGLYVTLNRKALDPSEMKKVSGTIRLKNIGTTEDENAKIKD